MNDNRLFKCPSSPCLERSYKLDDGISCGQLKQQQQQQQQQLQQKAPSSTQQSLTLWNYLLHELYDTNGTIIFQDKVEHLVNVVKVPAYLERVVSFGMLMCLDSFLYTFTILPLRVALSVWNLRFLRNGSTVRKADAVKGFVILAVLFLLLQLDTSKIYHNIRGQAAIKLYVMFNVLEIADKLCSAIGQDILECLLSLTTLTSNTKLLIFVLVAVGYCYLHSLVLLFQVITLNVAVNSYSNALLTLLLSNQFAEIKSAVFKKFDRENLFQLTCADITERFQLLVMLLVIGLRNMVEVNDIGLVPTFWAGWNRWLGALFGPALVVVGSEVIVDWLKHAYISKFNNIRPRIYRKYLDVLAIDYANHAFSDQILTKRTGLPVYPLAVVASKMMLQSYNIILETKASAAVSTIGAAAEVASSQPLPAATTILTTLSILYEQSVSLVQNYYLQLMGHPLSSASSSSPSPSASALPTTFIPDPSQIYISLTFILAIITLFIVLLAIKLVIGMGLLKYTSRRHSQMVTRGRLRSQSNNRMTDFLPDPTKGYGTVELDESMRDSLYEPEEEMPPNKKSNQPAAADDGIEKLLNVTRFKMAAKRIW